MSFSSRTKATFALVVLRQNLKEILFRQFRPAFVQEEILRIRQLIREAHMHVYLPVNLTFKQK